MNTGFLQKLAELSLVINSFQARENIYDTVCRLAMKIFDINLVWLGMVPEDDDASLPISGESPEEFCHHHIRFVYGFLDGDRDPTGLSRIQLDEKGVENLLYPDEHVLIMDQGVYWIINDIEAHNRHPDWRTKALHLGFRSAVGVPLIGGTGDMLGMMHFYSKRKNCFTEETTSAIRVFAIMVTTAIENRQLLDNLKQKIRHLEKAKEQTARSESHYRNLFASMRDVVIIADLSRTIIDVNQPALRTVFGYEANDLLGRSSAMLYADRAQFELAGIEVFDHQDTDNGKLLEMQFRRKSGEVFDGEMYALKLRGEDDRSVANFGVIRDISARKRAVEELAQSEAKFRSLTQEFNGLLAAIPDSLMLVDRQLSVLWTNHSTAETIPGHPGPIIQCFDSGSPQSVIVTGEDGRIFDIRVVPLADEEGRVAKVIQVKRDITDQKQLEDQYFHAQRMESVGRLAGGVAHDFNNMLGVILGYTEMVLAKTDRSDPRHNDLKEVLAAGKRSADIVRQLLAFARKQKVSPGILDLNGTIDGILKMLRRLIGEDINLTWRPSADRLNQGYIDVESRPGEGTTFKVYLPRHDDKAIAAVEDSKISAPTGRGEMILVMSGYTASVIADQGVLDDGTNFLRKPFSAVDLAVKVREVLMS